jgi:low temperature requirement protein LtrA
MVARRTDEDHRASTPLELFYDLCFVVAVSQASSELHHSLVEDDIRNGVVGFCLVFFAIWWAWMNFTWFASAYDVDDVPYRLTVLVEIAGVLILAAGIPRAFAEHDFAVITFGYVVMRVALVSQWVRAARANPDQRRCCLRYAWGVGVCTAGWALLLLLPDPWWKAGFLLMVIAELSVPVWAERHDTTPWHPRHIAERYGLFTLIVLGESVLAATVAIQSALDAGESIGDLLALVGGGLLIVFGMWWVYFAQPREVVLDHARQVFAHHHQNAFVWGYGHLLVFASAAAVGAGLEVTVDSLTGHTALSARASGLALAIPVACYLLSVWLLHARPHQRTLLEKSAFPITAVLVLLATLTGQPVLVIGVLVALLVGVTTAMSSRPATLDSHR